MMEKDGIKKIEKKLMKGRKKIVRNDWSKMKVMMEGKESKSVLNARREGGKIERWKKVIR